MQKIKSNIYSVGATDPERKLFDTLIPLPFGTSYNSFIVEGSLKTALIDTVDHTKSDILFENIELAGIKKIDYIVINHAEQDHTGTLPLLLEKFPEAMIICNDKCKEALILLLHIAGDRIKIIKDGEELSLGDKTLKFIYTPWVHWAETMCTYLKEDKILFSCDFFGSHFSFDDIFLVDENKFVHATKIYFAEIMMPFALMIKKNLAKLEEYSIDMIAPAHGPIHKNANLVISNYRDWISDSSLKNLVVIAYVSMHGSTRLLSERLKKTLEAGGVDVHLYDISQMDIGEVAVDLICAKSFVIGTPCFLSGIHPGAANLLYIANSLRPKTKFVSVIGSYGWSGGMDALAASMIGNLQAEIISPVIVKGLPIDSDMKKIDDLAKLLIEKHK